MATTLDVSGDYTLWDNDVAGTLRVRNYVGQYTDVTIARCFHEQLTQKEIEESAGKYISGDRAFNLPTALLGSTTPKVGDRFVVSTSDDTLTVNNGEQIEYRVIESMRKVWGTDWRIICSSPWVAYDLRDIISVRRPTLLPGETTGYTYLFQSIRASAQLMNRRSGTEAGYAHLNEEWHIAIAEDLDAVRSIRRQDQVVLGDGSLLQINEVRTEDRLRELSLLVCENEIASPLEPGA